MKTLILATLKKGWHNSFKKLSEEAHEILDDVSQILFYPGITSIDEAKETLENEGYYFYLPTRWDDDLDVSDNYNDLARFCKLIAELDSRAYPLTVDPEDIESFNLVDVSERFHHDICSVDYMNIRINDVETVKKLTNLIA